MSDNSEDKDCRFSWGDPSRTPRGIAKISGKTVESTKNCCEHELNCGVDVYHELFEDISKNNPRYFSAVRSISQLLGFHPSANIPRMSLPSIYVGAIVGYALQRRAEEDSNEENLSLGKRLQDIDGKLKNIMGNLEGVLGDNFAKENFGEELKELKYSIDSLAAEYVGQETYTRSLEAEKKTLIEEISDKDQHVKYLGEVLQSTMEELEIFRGSETDSEKKAREDFFNNFD